MYSSYKKVKTWKDGSVRRIEYIKEGTKVTYHREGDLPSVTEWYRDGTMKYEAYHQNGRLYREEGLAVRSWNSDGTPSYAAFYQIRGKNHRNEDLPAYFRYDDNGHFSEYYYKNGDMSRETGPASIHYDEKGKITSYNFCLGERHIPFWTLYEKASKEAKEILLRDWHPNLVPQRRDY